MSAKLQYVCNVVLRLNSLPLQKFFINLQTNKGYNLKVSIITIDPNIHHMQKEHHVISVPNYISQWQCDHASSHNKTLTVACLEKEHPPNHVTAKVSLHCAKNQSRKLSPIC